MCEVRPLHLPSTVLCVFYGYEVTPPQLPSSVVSVLRAVRPPPKVLMVYETDRLPPPWLGMLLYSYVQIYGYVFTSIIYVSLKLAL